MSGTSMDGVDAAVLETDGETIAGFGPTAFRPYAPAERAALRAAPRALAGRAGPRARSRRWCAARTPRRSPGSRASRSSASTARRWRTSRAGGARTRSAAATCWRATAGCRWSGTSAPRTWPAAARGRRWCRSSTSPAPGAIGAAAPRRLPQPRRRRQRHLGRPARAGAGGAGRARRLRHRAGQRAASTTSSRQRLGRAFDADGAVAAAGRVDAAVLARLAAHPYLRRTPPKSLDRQDFHGFLDRVAHLSDRGRRRDARGADRRLRGRGGAALPRAAGALAGLRRRAAQPRR